MKEMTQAAILAYLAKNWVRILVRACVTCVFACGLFVLYYACAPRTERYATDVSVQLESSLGNRLYPNGTSFGAQDIISSPVLARLWKEFGFDKRGVKFDDFAAWFSVVGYDKERARIDAEFQTKMAKRNISVVELTALQKDYEAKLAALDTGLFRLVLKPDCLLDRETAVNLLNAVPLAWYREYSVLKAPALPAVTSPAAIRSFVARVKSSDGVSFAAYDVMRQYVTELEGVCAYIRSKLAKDRNLKAGEKDVGTFESAIRIYKKELTRLRGAMKGAEADSAYLVAQKDELACAKAEIGERINALQAALDAIVGVGPVKAASDVQPAGEGVTIQADSGFFADITALIRRNVYQDAIRRYADQIVANRGELAKIRAQEIFYEQITGGADKAVSAAAVQSQEALIADILKTAEELLAFRDYCLEIYRTPDQFYAVSALASYGKSFVFSIVRFAAVLFALLLLVNAWCLVRDFNRE